METRLRHDLFLRAQVVSVASFYDPVMWFANVACLWLRIATLTLLSTQGLSSIFYNSRMIGLCCYIHLSGSNRVPCDNVLVFKNVLNEIEAVTERHVFKGLAHSSVRLKVVMSLRQVVSALHLEAALLTLVQAWSFDAKVHISYNFIYFKYYEIN